MALFPWKKGGGEGDGKDGGGNGTPPGSGGKDDSSFELSPEKAAKFFDSARTRHDVGSYDYAMNMWLNGLRFDPGNVAGVRGFFASANSHIAATKEKNPSKDLEKIVSGGNPVQKYLSAVLAWGFVQNDGEKSPERAVKASTAASDLGLREVSVELGSAALKRVMNQSRPRKDQFVRLMELFQKNEAFDLAVVAGDGAKKIDPTDQRLSADLRNLSAQLTMAKGGFSQNGEAGGFRGNVKDIEKQRTLEEEERLHKTGDVLDRQVLATKMEYEKNPGDRPTILRYAKALDDRGLPEDEETAIALFTKSHKETQEFRFRQAAGAIRMKQGRRLLKALEAAMKAHPGDAGHKAAFVEAEQKQIALEIAEFEMMVKEYPTDLRIKFDLGKRFFLAHKYSEAIAQFQQAKTEGKLKNQVLLYLGQCFEQIDWVDEAVETYRQAMEGYPDPNDDLGMELRYHLVLCLAKRAAANKDLSSAEEADKLASGIAMQNIAYKDIRERRTQIKALMQSLKATPNS